MERVTWKNCVGDVVQRTGAGDGGSPYDPKYSKLYIEQSPITYANQIKTPTLIVGDTGDIDAGSTGSTRISNS